MLKITDCDAQDFSRGVSLAEALDVRVVHEINGARTLDFVYPENDKARLVRANKLVICEGQAYRVMNVSLTRDGRNLYKVRCRHIFNADTPNLHIQNMPDMIGVRPSDVLKRAVKGTEFHLLTDAELSKIGLQRVDYDGFKIDFFSCDKTNPYDVIRAVTEICGKGELYTDNRSFALVERIGRDSAARLDLTLNMKDMTVERDITDMVTRLYPYGKDDLHIGSVNGGKQYVESPNASVYGVREGYRDYSSITKPAELYRRALWEFDEANTERVDVPCVNITGTLAEISKLGGKDGIRIGDGVTVVDGGDEVYRRVIRTEYSPYGAESAVITLGHVKRDMFFYLEQMGALARRYKKVSTADGKVRAASVSGIIRNGVVSDSVTVGEINIGQNRLTTDDEGNLLLNGERLIKDTGGEENEQDI